MKKLLSGPNVRQAIQTALAVGVSIGIGTLVSGQRWYWAALTAFLVATGVASRGEGLIKAFQRLSGTLAGVAVGIGLVSAVSGNTDLSLALVLICVFLAFYAFQAAYTTMSFFITLFLALLYGILGQFKPELLLLRFEETAVGSTVAVIVIMTVFPAREREVFRKAFEDFSDSLSKVLEKISSGAADTRAAAVEMQTKLQTLRLSVGGLKRRWLPLVPDSARMAVRAAMECSYLVREMVQEGCRDKSKIAGIREKLKAIQIS